MDGISPKLIKLPKPNLPKMLSDIFIKATSVSQKQTRSSIAHIDLLYIPRYRSNKLQRSLKYQGVKVWNSIPPEIRNFLSIFFLQTQKTFHNTLLKSKNKKALKLEIQKSVVNYIFVKLSQRHVALYFPSPCSISQKITDSHGGCRLNGPKGPFAAFKSTVFFNKYRTFCYCIVSRLK